MKMDQKNQEQEMLLELSKGNQAAFKMIYHEYGPKLLGNLVKLVKSDSVAQEILQDVFIKVWENHENIDVEKSFRSYLFKIAENKAFDFFRKAARDKKLQETLIAAATEQFDQIETNLFAKENAFILEKAISELPRQRQLIFRLSKLDDMSYEEISKRLGISTSTISDHIVKATKAIRDYFQKHPELLILFIAAQAI
jgi:RNA polymerase sigma-70 factor (family 1)